MGESIILSTLNDSLKERIIVSVFSNRNNPESCAVGFIEKISDEQVVIKHVTSTGLYDGYAIRRLNDIFRVDINGQYEKRLLKLYNVQNQEHPNIIKTKKEANLFKEVLTVAQNLKLVVSVCIDETEEQEDIVGWVKDFGDKEVIIKQISFEGLDDGESAFYIEDIVKINCDSNDERVLGMLNSKLNVL